MAVFVMNSFLHDWISDYPPISNSNSTLSSKGIITGSTSSLTNVLNKITLFTSMPFNIYIATLAGVVSSTGLTLTSIPLS